MWVGSITRRPHSLSPFSFALSDADNKLAIEMFSGIWEAKPHLAVAMDPQMRKEKVELENVSWQHQGRQPVSRHINSNTSARRNNIRTKGIHCRTRGRRWPVSDSPGRPCEWRPTLPLPTLSPAPAPCAAQLTNNEVNLKLFLARNPPWALMVAAAEGANQIAAALVYDELLFLSEPLCSSGGGGITVANYKGFPCFPQSILRVLSAN